MAQPSTSVIAREGGQFKLSFTRADVARVSVSDVDLVLVLQDGRRVVLLAGALEAMSAHPPQLVFADGAMLPANALLALVPEFALPVPDSPLAGPLASPLPGSDKAAAPEPSPGSGADAVAPADDAAAARETPPPPPEATAQALQAASGLPGTHEVVQSLPPPLHPQLVLPPSERAGSVPVLLGFVGAPEFRGVVLTNLTGVRQDGAVTWGSGGDAASGTDPSAPVQAAAEHLSGTAGNDVLYGDDPQRLGAGFAKLMTVTLGNTKSVDSFTVSGLPAGFGFSGGTQDAAGRWHLPVPAPISVSNFDGTYALAEALTYPTDLPLDSNGFAASFVFTIDITITDLTGASVHYLRTVIDTERLRPDPAATVALPGVAQPLRAGDEILTYVARNLEPYRGFHRFMRALPAILRARPQARCVIVGGDGVSYGRPPRGAAHWRDAMLAEVGAGLPMSRVHFTGTLAPALYRQVLQVSRCHVYLTYPFVLSWSLVEAMSTGCTLVASRTAPVQEAIDDGVHGHAVDFFDGDALAATVVDVLARPKAHAHLGAQARARVVERYDLQTRCLPQLLQLVRALLPGGVQR